MGTTMVWLQVVHDTSLSSLKLEPEKFAKAGAGPSPLNTMLPLERRAGTGRAVE